MALKMFIHKISTYLRQSVRIYKDIRFNMALKMFIHKISTYLRQSVRIYKDIRFNMALKMFIHKISTYFNVVIAIVIVRPFEFEYSFIVTCRIYDSDILARKITLIR